MRLGVIMTLSDVELYNLFAIILYSNGNVIIKLSNIIYKLLSKSYYVFIVENYTTQFLKGSNIYQPKHEILKAQETFCQNMHISI